MQLRPRAYVAIKLDLNKAYDRVCWDFLFKVLDRLGFDSVWIDWVKQCVCTVKYSIYVNGAQVCNVIPYRGLRQGDPLSPYLFLFVADVFSIIIQKAIQNKSLKGIRMKRECPVVSHLLFADDSMVFLEAEVPFCSNFKYLASCFSEASGLSINVHKSSLYFPANANDNVKDAIKGILGMQEMDPKAKYLGLPADWGKSKKEAMGFINDKVTGKVQGWGGKSFNHASKETLIKSVIQNMPVYPFMCFKAPLSLCSSLNSIVSNFWWKNSESKFGIHWGAWSKLNAPKGEGGLGFKDFATFNNALLAK